MAWSAINFNNCQGINWSCWYIKVSTNFLPALELSLLEIKAAGKRDQQQSARSCLLCIYCVAILPKVVLRITEKLDVPKIATIEDNPDT